MGMYSFGVADSCSYILPSLYEERTLNRTIRGKDLELCRFFLQCFLTAKWRVPPVSQDAVWQISFLAAVWTLERGTLK